MAEGDVHVRDPGTPDVFIRGATLDEFVANIDTFLAQIQAGVAPSLLADANRAVEDAVKRKVKELARDLARGLLAYEDRLPGDQSLGLYGGISRTTVLSAARLREAAGRNILYSPEQLALLGWSDDQIEQFLRKAAAIDRDRDLGIINAEDLLFTDVAGF